MTNRSPVTETIKRVREMIHHVQENLTTDEWALFLDLADPLPEPEPVQSEKPKRKRKRAGKSVRATSLASAIKGTAKPVSSTCTYDLGNGHGSCGGPEDDPIHDKEFGYAGYHEFVGPVTATGASQ